MASFAEPDVSLTTLSLAGILIDVYGLSQLSETCAFTCLWLLHPRTHSRKQMKDFACKVVRAWGQKSGGRLQRGLLALAFDLPNHGSRLINQAASRDWTEGNETHAEDLLNMVLGGKKDLSFLITKMEELCGRGKIESHLALGWSLGGHIAWQAWLWDQRIDAAVVIVGCPDLLGLMQLRAQKSRLAFDGPFLGSTYFPVDSIEKCLHNDPKAFLFGTADLESLKLSSSDLRRLQTIFNEKIQGKSLFVCSGQEDDLVPYASSRPFLQILQSAINRDGWYTHGHLRIDYRVYSGVGHDFSPEMVEDSIDWIMEISFPQRPDR